MRKDNTLERRHFFGIFDSLIDVLDIFLTKAPSVPRPPVAFPSVAEAWKRDFTNMGNDMRKAIETVTTRVKNGTA